MIRGQEHLRLRDKDVHRPEGGVCLACARLDHRLVPQGTAQAVTGGSRLNGQSRAHIFPPIFRLAHSLDSQSIQPAASWAKTWVPVGTSDSLDVAL